MPFYCYFYLLLSFLKHGEKERISPLGVGPLKVRHKTGGEEERRDEDGGGSNAVGSINYLWSGGVVECGVLPIVEEYRSVTFRTLAKRF